jgi:hypothetical protein
VAFDESRFGGSVVNAIVTVLGLEAKTLSLKKAVKPVVKHSVKLTPNLIKLFL